MYLPGPTFTTSAINQLGLCGTALKGECDFPALLISDPGRKIACCHSLAGDEDVIRRDVGKYKKRYQKDRGTLPNVDR